MDVGNALQHLFSTVSDGALGAAGAELLDFLKQLASRTPALSGAMTVDGDGRVDIDVLTGVVEALARRDEHLTSLIQRYAASLPHDSSSRNAITGTGDIDQSTNTVSIRQTGTVFSRLNVGEKFGRGRGDRPK